MPAITSAVLSDIIYDTGIMWGGIFSSSCISFEVQKLKLKMEEDYMYKIYIHQSVHAFIVYFMYIV